MSNAVETYMPLVIEKYLGDTAHLTTMQHGAYLLLLMHYWRRGAALPDDDARLAATAKLSAAEWRKNKPVLAEFFVVADGVWTQKRAEAELERARGLKSRKSVAGSLGAASKWGSGKSADEHARTRGQRLSEARQKASHSSDEWLALIAICGARCVRCGTDGKLVKDHIKPIYQGGSDGIENLQPLCVRCNSSKGPEAIDHRPNGWQERLAEWLADACHGTDRTPSPPPNILSPDANASGRVGASRRKPKVPMPDDWAPKDRHTLAAEQRGVSLDLEAQKARNWAGANDARQADWDRFFDNWLLKARPDNGQRHGADKREIQLAAARASAGYPDGGRAAWSDPDGEEVPDRGGSEMAAWIAH